MSKTGVAIGLDVGEKRIGVSRGDFDVRIAVPLTVLTNNNEIFTEVAKVVNDNHAETVVIGLPRNADGQETAQSQVSRDFATNLANFINAEIILQDESLTSVLAERNLRERKDFNENMLRDGTVDSEAAALFLTDYLERNYSNATA